MARRSLYSLLPQIWHRLDTERVLERFCAVLDDAWDRAHEKARDLFATRSIDKIPDRYLKLRGPIVGYDWRPDKDHAENRRRTAHAIPRHSAKGSYDLLADIIRENGGGEWSVQDNASKLMVLGKQAKMAQRSCRLVDADFWHDGAFLLTVTDAVDRDSLRLDLAETIPAGERWYLQIREAETDAVESVWFENEIGYESETDITRGALGYGTLNIPPEGRTALFLGFAGNGRAGVESVSEDGDIASDGYLWANDPFLCNRTDILVNMGSPMNPLPEALAAIQPDSEDT